MRTEVNELCVMTTVEVNTGARDSKPTERGMYIRSQMEKQNLKA